MKSEAQVQEMCALLSAMLNMGDDGPFSPAMRDNIGAVQNCLCWILEDGSKHATAFTRNHQKLIQWCAGRGVSFIKMPREGKPS